MNLLKKYSEFVSNHPWITLLLVLIITGIAIYYNSTIKNISQDYKDMLPENVETVHAFDIIEDNFGGSDSALIAIELDPEYLRSNEPRDIREKEVISYIDLLTQVTETIGDVNSASSPSTVLRSLNNNVLPKSKREINDLIRDNPALFADYVSDDKAMALIKISLSPDFDAEEIEEDLGNLISEVKKPAGLIVQPAGDTMADPVIMRTIGPEMQKTSTFSLIAILIILLIMMGNPKYALTPLTVIMFGVIWAMGFVGFIGMGMSSGTSSAVSMIMGIGIDFGIQTITRFRHEMKIKDPKESLVSTLNGVFMPMFTTTLAALIGFQAMTMGNLSMMQDLGRMMAFGVAACFLAALSVLPALLIITEKIKIRKIFGGIIK